jgi:hypothetical protein
MFGASQVAGHLQKLIAHVPIGTEGLVVADRSISDAKLVKQVPFIHGWPPTNALRIDLQFSPVSGLFASANHLLIQAGPAGRAAAVINQMNAMPMFITVDLVDPKNPF